MLTALEVKDPWVAGCYLVACRRQAYATWDGPGLPSSSPLRQQISSFRAKCWPQFAQNVCKSSFYLQVYVKNYEVCKRQYKKQIHYEFIPGNSPYLCHTFKFNLSATWSSSQPEYAASPQRAQSSMWAPVWVRHTDLARYKRFFLIWQKWLNSWRMRLQSEIPTKRGNTDNSPVTAMKNRFWICCQCLQRKPKP